jgi:CRP-like cAMP-binding protein/HEAT repeat protein
MQRLLSRLTVIEPSERGVVALLLGLSFTLGGALVFVDIAARALFLDRYPVTLLPWAYLGAAIVIPIIGIIYRALQRRLTVGILTIGMLVVLCGSIAALWFGVASLAAAWPIFALFIWYRLLYAYNGLLIGSVAGRLFTLRQGKRLFGLVGTGEPIAGILGYFSGAALAQAIGTVNMLAIAVVLLGVSVVIAARLSRTAPQLREMPPEDVSSEHGPERSSAGFGRYVALLAAVAVISILFYLFADYGFSAESRRVFTSADQLAGFFGVFFGFVAIGRILARSVLSGWVLNRFGLRVALLIMPVSIAVSIGALLIFGIGLGIEGAIFFFMGMTRFVGSIVYPSIQRAAMQVLYQPLPLRRRLALQATVESIIEPVAIGVGSLLLLGLTLQESLPIEILSLVILAIVAALGAISFSILHDYRTALSRALARRLLEGASLSFYDASSRAVIERTLASPHAGEVVYAIDLLSRAAPPELLLRRLPALLSHADPRVRREAARRIGELAQPELLRSLADAALREADPAVRAQLLRLTSGAELAQVRQLLHTSLSDPSPVVRDTALAMLMRAQVGAPEAEYAAVLSRLADSPDPAERARAATIIGELAEGWGSLLDRLLADDATTVRQAALASAGRRTDLALTGVLIAQFANPQLRSNALAALVRRGPDALPAIGAAFTSGEMPPAVLMRLARAAGRIGGRDAVALLLRTISYPDDEVRHAVALALRRAGMRVRGSQAAIVRDQMRAEAALAVWTLHAHHGIGDGEETTLLRAALDGQVARLRRRLFAMLELIYDPAIVRRIQRHLDSALLDKRDYARELFEVHVESALRQHLLPLVDPGKLPRPSLDLPTEPLGWSRAIRDADAARATPWMRACARYFLQGAGSDPIVARVQLLQRVGIFADTPDDMLAEIAPLMAEEHVEGDTPMFYAGDHGDKLYIVVDGSIRIHNGPQTITILGPGSVFGEMALLDGAPRAAAASPDGAARLLALAREPFFELMEDRIEITRGIIQVLNNRLRETVQSLSEARAAARDAYRSGSVIR